MFFLNPRNKDNPLKNIEDCYILDRDLFLSERNNLLYEHLIISVEIYSGYVKK
jgi:hypothetical protein